MEYLEYSNFAHDNKKKLIYMLGFTSTRKPVSGEIAKAIREQLARIESNTLSEKDKELKSMQQGNTKYSIVD